MGEDELRKAFLRGYEEGLKAAWREIGLLTTRGYSSTELSVMAKSKMAVLYRDVEAMADRLSDEDVPDLSAAAPPEPKGVLGGRGAYLVREPKASRIFDLYRELVSAGARGLCITRIHPDDLRSKHGLSQSGFIWLSSTPGRKTKGMAVAAPTDLVDVATAIAEFAGSGGNAVVLLEGVEYMMGQNGFASFLRFLQKVNEKIVLNDSYLLISANPAAMKEQEYKLLAREMVGEI